MDKKDFRIGDLVRLKSGGPIMTIEWINPHGTLSCGWFVDGVHKDYGFLSDALQKCEAANG